MKLISRLAILLLLAYSCSSEKEQKFNSVDNFSSELKELKEYFQIPGMAVLVQKEGETLYEDYLGYSETATQSQLDASTTFPIASLTKIFSGLMIMKLAEEGKLKPEDPIKKYIPEAEIDDSIQIKHVLSHTSQGDIGKHFYYSSRFGWLTKVIEKASGMSFAEYAETLILSPLEMQNSFLLKDSLQLAQKDIKMARPYMLDDGIQDGFIDYGYSSSAGMVSTVKDLAVLDRAMDANTIISEASRDKMFSAFKELPYGYGIFHQEFNDLNLIWGYGQYDCYSSLFLKVPSKKITLILLANNNLMSDPARLIYGDALSSLFVMSFLKNFVFEIEDMPLLETEASLAENKSITSDFYREKLLAQALAESFMARFDTGKVQSSARLLEKTFSLFPDYKTYADISLMHNLSFLKDVAFFMELGDFNVFDEQLETIGNALLSEDPDNPYLHTYLGTFYDRKGDLEKAKPHFEHIVNNANFSRNWYTAEAEGWLRGQQ
ncbi:serine hydrolase [Leptobacterium flavescens]|uniref:Serine hydrolase n=1 Tax=Leptobacterium flavescens TaxID=472055 RepID=A0A6P0UPU1_9FLAO|nr:serine hydrolase domain-containing protein [Leptobacterium flavescens]NER15341.1 serine hydrolase [Leptobacterium flavescens]